MYNESIAFNGYAYLTFYLITMLNRFSKTSYLQYNKLYYVDSQSPTATFVARSITVARFFLLRFHKQLEFRSDGRKSDMCANTMGQKFPSAVQMGECKCYVYLTCFIRRRSPNWTGIDIDFRARPVIRGSMRLWCS